MVLKEMRRVGLKNKWAWVYVLVMACLTFTVIPGWLPFVRKEWLLLVIGTVAAVPLCISFLHSKPAICLYLYFIILYFNKMSGDVVYSSLPNLIYEVLQYLVPASMFYYMTKTSDMKFAKLIVNSLLIIVCIESVASFVINSRTPNIIRELEALTRLEGDTQFTYNFYKLGLANYSFCHALPILIPPLICWIKDNSISKKLILWCVLALICLLVYISASSTAILLMALMLVVGFLTSVTNTSRNSKTLIAIFLVFAPLLFSQQLQLTTIDTVTEFLPQDSYITQKMESIRNSIEYEKSEGDVDNRVVRYTRSFNSFIEHPFLGSNDSNGEHSAFLDRLANLGLIGISPLFVFFILQFVATIKSIPDKYKLFYYEGITAALLIFLLKAVSLVPILLMSLVVLPFMFVTIPNRK